MQYSAGRHNCCWCSYLMIIILHARTHWSNRQQREAKKKKKKGKNAQSVLHDELVFTQTIFTKRTTSLLNLCSQYLYGFLCIMYLSSFFFFFYFGSLFSFYFCYKISVCFFFIIYSSVFFLKTQQIPAHKTNGTYFHSQKYLWRLRVIVVIRFSFFFLYIAINHVLNT